MSSLTFLLAWLGTNTCHGLLYPQSNQLRALDSLNGLWTFVAEPELASDLGLGHKWNELDLDAFPNATRVPVPSAYNELFADDLHRQHVGWVWYQTHYSSPHLADASKRRVLRFGSVNYNAMVFVNSVLLTTHTGGHLPFEAEIPQGSPDKPLKITVAVNNTLSSRTIPPGEYRVLHLRNQSFVQQKPGFDFFNYAGILRPVQMQVMNAVFLKNLWIRTADGGHVFYKYQLDRKTNVDVDVTVTLIDPSGKTVETVKAPAQFRPVDNVQLWWPRGYGAQHLYKLKVQLVDRSNPDRALDEYTETFGFRTVQFRGKQMYVNDKPFYCIGFGMHEDFDLHGRGYNEVVLTRDLNMLEWLNANCYRTSHYPYSEARAYEADRRGIMVITEAPSVGLGFFDKDILALHQQMMTEMVERDRNHPSVCAWSLANEPWMENDGAGVYFAEMAKFTKQLDPSRPITIVFSAFVEQIKESDFVQYLDFVCINHYGGWYVDFAHAEVVEEQVYEYADIWLQTFPDKPLMISEYGGEGLPGFYGAPAIPFTEQYQVELIKGNHAAFDRLRKEGRLTGEMIWNFADFMTAPGN